MEEKQEKIEKLEQKLYFAMDALRSVMRYYAVNGSCGEDCVGYYMYETAKKAITELEKE